jgi:hypothetical protein
MSSPTLSTPYGIVEVGGVLYVVNNGDSSILRVDPVTLVPIDVFFSGFATGIYGIASDGTYLYVANYNDGVISQINIANPTIFNLNWSTGYNTPYYMVIDGLYMYVSDYVLGTVSQVSMLDGSIANASWATGLSEPTGMAVYGGTMYIGDYDLQKILTVPYPTGGVVTPLGTFTNFVDGIVIDINGYIYASCDTTVDIVSLSGTFIETYISGLTGAYNVCIGNDRLYTSDSLTNTMYSNPLYTFICFLEGTRVLCCVDNTETYVRIENIEPGMLVKTYQSGYIPVDTIGSGKMYNTSKGSKNDLYVYSNENCDDLVLTGCHSVLVHNISEDERNDIRRLFGKIFVTEGMYRLMSCVDKNANVYPEEGVFTIWHLALENENYYSNYGIYANGMLVESCSKRMITEYSGFKLKQK